MLTVTNLSYSFPQKELFHDISFTLEDGQHGAFIGTSGSGKSTMIDMMMNPDHYLYDGKIEKIPGCRVGYVSQFSQIEEASDMTVFEYIGEEFIRLQNEITSICAEMETVTDLETLLEKYQQTLDEFQAIGGDDFESNISRKLNLADLTRHENLMVSKLSGGEFKLVQVIKEMLTGPDFVIMDEPDVFLDFDNLNSLKNLINAHKGTMLIITHNRYLLNHCFDKIIHLENKEVQEFDGRYVDYNFALLQRKIELQEQAIADTEEIERLEKVIDHLRSVATVHTDAARGKSLYARVKIKERLEARRIKAPFVEIKEPQIHLNAKDGLEESVAIKVHDYSVTFDDVILQDVNFEIKSTDKVALIGGNGTGKTTLLREIYQNNHASITIGEGVEVAFLSQFQGEMLNEANSIFDELYSVGFQTYQEASAYLSTYGFDEETLHQKISTLSGGEKNLLQLAKISVQGANMLLLDEPTSHLDTYSQISLEKALSNYNGGILMVSHDFYTIANCMDYVLLIENKTIRKMSNRKFRKMIYANHYDQNYLEIEQKKKAVETKIELALKDSDFEQAKDLSVELEELIGLL